LSLFDELKRRKVFRVAIGYVIAAWVIAQVADLVADNFNAPDWVMQMIITLLIVGLPVSLLLSWAFDFTADGIRRTESGETEGSLVVSNKSVLALVAGTFVVLAVVFYVIWPRGDRSIAVLPFEDVSPGGNQAYLGNGIADELRLELQGLDGLRVAGRTSSIAYAQEDGKTIGETLNVETILEGSVRKEGNRIRIAVQLTDAADGFTIWAESFDRDLERLLEMQEEIARSVAGSLGVRLGVGGVNAFRGAGTQNVDAYEAYLQAINNDSYDSAVQESVQLLERALVLDPNYAAAWSALGNAVLNEVWDADVDEVPTIMNRANELASEGVRLNPESSAALSILGNIRVAQLDWIGAEQVLTRAIELLADRPSVARYAIMLMRSGRTTFADRQFEISRSLEPLDGRPVPLFWHVRMAQGRIAEAREIRFWRQEVSPGPDFILDKAQDNLDIAINEKDPAALMAAIRAMPRTSVAYSSLYEPLLPAIGAPDEALAILRDVYRDESLQWPRKLHDIGLASAFFGDPEFALRVKGEDVLIHPIRIGALWYPVMSEVRRLPGFKDLVTELNLVEYWRAYGWADACAPVGDKDFTCT